jgi:hypothetical protein
LKFCGNGRKSGLSPKKFHMGFLVAKMSMRQFFLFLFNIVSPILLFFYLSPTNFKLIIISVVKQHTMFLQAIYIYRNKFSCLPTSFIIQVHRSCVSRDFVLQNQQWCSHTGILSVKWQWILCWCI